MSEYIVSEIGLVFSKKRNRFLTQRPNNSGYLQVKIYGKNTLVHRLVALKFLPNPHRLPQVNHKDGNKLNNDISNLEWISNIDNKRHAWKTGLFGDHNKGVNNPNAKLNSEIANSIKKLYAKGDKSMRQLAVEFGVASSTICYILNDKTWTS